MTEDVQTVDKDKKLGEVIDILKEFRYTMFLLSLIENLLVW